jgi:hypothetical protein
MAGALVGLIKSPDFTLSLGAMQCLLGLCLFYYSWVSYRRLAVATKWLAFVGLLCVLAAALLAKFGTPHVSGQPGFAIAGTGTHHGVALMLVITAAILAGVAAFGRRTVLRWGAAVICAALFIIVLFSARESLRSLVTGYSIEGRWPFWERTVRLLADSPFSGLGLGCWALAYHGTEALTHPTQAHNAYLELYANTGILGMLALVLVLVLGFKLCLNIIRSPRDHPWYGFGVGVVLACVATLLAGVVESAPTGVPLVGESTYWYMVSPAPWILAGLLVCVHRLMRRQTTPDKPC